MKSWMVAVIALGLGGAVSAALLVAANPARDQLDVYVVTRYLPAGAGITRDSLRLEALSSPHAFSSLFGRGEEAQFDGRIAGHDLSPGQLLQRSDVLSTDAVADERLVFVPVKDAPPALPGSKLDLLVVAGTPDHPTVVPFALGVPVRAVAAGGFIVAVYSRQAAAFVYAAEAMRLAAVIAAPNSAIGSESPIGAPDQALAVASQP